MPIKPATALIFLCLAPLGSITLPPHLRGAPKPSAPPPHAEASAPAAPMRGWANLGLYSERTSYQLPLNDVSFQETQLDKDALLAGIGLVVGPVPQAALTLSGAYSYQHEWYSEAGLNSQTRAPRSASIAAAFGSKHLERLHTWQLELGYQLLPPVAIGLWEEIKIRNAGSRYLPEDDDLGRQGSYRISDQIATLPWLRYQWQGDRQATWLVAYIYKEYHHLFSDASYQTYSLDRDEGRFISVMLAHRYEAAELWQLTGSAAALRTRANDPWLERKRLSLGADLSYHINTHLATWAQLGLYQDDYLRSYFLPGDTPTPARAQRTDHGYTLMLGLRYDVSSRWRLACQVATFKNQSPRFKDKAFTRNSAMITISMALPAPPVPLLPSWLRAGDSLQPRFEVNAIQ